MQQEAATARRMDGGPWGAAWAGMAQARLLLAPARRLGVERARGCRGSAAAAGGGSTDWLERTSDVSSASEKALRTSALGVPYIEGSQDADTDSSPVAVCSDGGTKTRRRCPAGHALRNLRPASTVHTLVADAGARSTRARRSAVAGFVRFICVPNVRRFGETLRQLMRRDDGAVTAVYIQCTRA
jgi:hypothetical protein